jgi:hypothetical protein
VPPTLATEALRDLAQLLPAEMEQDDLIDLGDTQRFETVVMDGECAS